MKYLRKFDSVSDMNTTLANSTIGILGVAYEGGNVVMENKPTPPPNNEIWYTSTDGNVIEPATVKNFNVNIVSNTYSGGKGVIKFDGEVTSVGNNSFRTRNTLYSITLPDSVISIGSSCFYNSASLSNITIPDSVTTISQYAFYGCTNLTSIILPHSLTAIANQTFFNCIGITSITIPDSITSIGEMAFQRCTGLTSITIPSSVTSIGYATFRGCTSLSHIVVDSNNPKYDSRDNCNAIIETATNTLVAGCKNTVIPNTVIIIGDESFHSQTGLTNITIPNSVKTIKGGAFNSCRGLVTLTVPNTVTTIEREAFYSIPNVIYSGSAAGSPWGANAVNGCVDGDFVYTDNAKTNLVDYIGTSTSIKIPDSVITLGDKTFMYIKNDITSIDFGNGLVIISEYAFTPSKNIESKLTYVIIGTGISSIGGYAFYNCINLNSITCNATTPPTLGEGAFYETNNCPIYVPSGSVEAYKAATNWSTYADRIQAIQ